MGQHAEVFGEMPYITDTEAFNVPVNPNGRTFCGDLDIHIDSQGQWSYNGSMIPSKEMVCLFAAMLVSADDGRYWLVSPNEVGRIDVDDAPFIAVRTFSAGNATDQSVSIVTNVDHVITIGPNTPLILKTSPVSGTITPYVIDENGLEVKVTFKAKRELIALGAVQKRAGRNIFGLWSDGAFFPLETATDPCA